MQDMCMSQNAVKKDAGIITSLWMAMWIWTRLKQSGILEKEMRSEGFRGMKTVWSEWQGTSRREKQKRKVSKDMVCIKGTAETERKSQSLQNETEGCGQDRKRRSECLRSFDEMVWR